MTPARHPANVPHLISHVLCPYVQRAVITLTEKGVPFRRTDIDLAAKPDWFLAISPLGKVPVLELDGGVLFESAAIVEYLDETTPNPMHPRDPLERARHRAWIAFASALLDTIAGYYGADTMAALAIKRETLVSRFQTLDEALGDGPYFAGRRFSLVDAAFAPAFRYLDCLERIEGGDFLEHAPRARRYRAALAERPSVRDAVAPDYPERLMRFIVERDKALAALARSGGVA